VKLVLKRERSLEQISLDLGIRLSTLRRWYTGYMAKKKGARFKKGARSRR